MKNSGVCAVILAGGSGTRLWPLSRLRAPKQFSKIFSEESLLESTISRVTPPVDRSEILVVTSEQAASAEGYQLLEPFQKILEPTPRNTAPAIAAAALKCKLEGKDPVMVVLPSDHLIRNVEEFRRDLGIAIEAARQGKLVTFGIPPASPETGYGYIETDSSEKCVPVKSFREKPDRMTAQLFVKSGRHFWNSGIFVWKASAILSAISRTAPELHEVLKAIERDAERGSFGSALKEHFAAAPSVSIDRGVLEKCGDIVMVHAAFDWSDVGSWDAVFDVSEKDANNNAIAGNVTMIDCDNSLVRSHSRLVAAVDMKDTLIIETRDAVLVARRGAGQKIGEVVSELARRSATEHIFHATVERPWGSYTVLEEGAGFKIKRIEVRPGGAISLQRHRHRSEHWVVVHGTATVTRGDEVILLRSNESTYIPANTVHRLQNLTEEPVQIIEVQVGSYVGEDDIERISDQYGRGERSLSVSQAAGSEKP